MENDLNYSIQIDVTNATIDFQEYLYNVLNAIKLNHIGIFDYHTLSNNEQINDNNE